jgi:hypothetical protein
MRVSTPDKTNERGRDREWGIEHFEEGQTTEDNKGALYRQTLELCIPFDFTGLVVDFDPN